MWQYLWLIKATAATEHEQQTDSRAAVDSAFQIFLCTMANYIWTKLCVKLEAPNSTFQWKKVHSACRFLFVKLQSSTSPGLSKLLLMLTHQMLKIKPRMNSMKLSKTYKLKMVPWYPKLTESSNRKKTIPNKLLMKIVTPALPSPSTQPSSITRHQGIHDLNLQQVVLRHEAIGGHFTNCHLLQVLHSPPAGSYHASSHLVSNHHKC